MSASFALALGAITAAAGLGCAADSIDGSPLEGIRSAVFDYIPPDPDAQFDLFGHTLWVLLTDAPDADEMLEDYRDWRETEEETGVGFCEGMGALLDDHHGGGEHWALFVNLFPDASLETTYPHEDDVDQLPTMNSNLNRFTPSTFTLDASAPSGCRVDGESSVATGGHATVSDFNENDSLDVSLTLDLPEGRVHGDVTAEPGPWVFSYMVALGYVVAPVE